jgi:hypothetical protein
LSHTQKLQAGLVELVRVYRFARTPAQGYVGSGAFRLGAKLGQILEHTLGVSGAVGDVTWRARTSTASGLKLSGAARDRDENVSLVAWSHPGRRSVVELADAQRRRGEWE